MSKLTVGVAGAGRIGKVHVGTLVRNLPEVHVAAITDPRGEEARKVAEQHSIPAIKRDFDELVQDPEIDAVLICSPTDTHADYIIAAARAGKNIFCEKPVALSLDVIRQALEAVNQCGVRMMIGFNRRFDANFQKVRSLVENGDLGDLHILKITSRDPAPPPPEYISASGGMFLDMTIHDFDMARFVTGSEVVQVSAEAGVLVDPRIGEQGDVDTAVITLRFENGALGVIDNSRRACYGYDQRLELFGSKGMVRIDNCRHDTHEFFDAAGSQGSLPLDFFMDRYAQSYATELKAFVRSLLEGSEFPVSGDDGLLSVAIGLAARRSVDEHRPVKMSEILG